MKSYWSDYWKRTVSGIFIIAILAYMNLGTAASTVFFLTVIYALNPLDKVRKETGEKMPLIKGSLLYFALVSIGILIEWYRVGFFDHIL